MMKPFIALEIFIFYQALLQEVIFCSEGNHIKGLDDSILFRLNWPGQVEKLLESPDYEKLVMTTVNNEKFQCLVPLSYGETSKNEGKYKGPNPLQLLMPFFKKKICILKPEAFWTYEVCHGHSVKQYHDVREENSHQYQDYVLGAMSIGELEKQAQELDELLELNPHPDIPHTMLGAVSVPYFPVTYNGGTACDLTGQPRVTRILYVCFEEGRNSIFSVKEIFSCEYEVIALSPILCQHPDYRPHEVPQTNLHCIPTHPSQVGQKRPKDLLHIEAESLKLRTHGTLLGNDISRGAVRLKLVEEEDDEEGIKESWPSQSRASSIPAPLIDSSLVQKFLKGEHCLQGGSGWWKFEFCFGKEVQQYHENRDGSRYTIILGQFNLNKHQDWISVHPSKLLNNAKNQVSHFYSEGDFCETVGKKRTVEVRLKCKETLSQSSVALYLLEPKTCEYVLGVETSLVCSLLHGVDEYGLFTSPQKNENKEKSADDLNDEKIKEPTPKDKTKGPLKDTP